MREIKFRGKRVDNSEWVYGNYMEKIDPTKPTAEFWAAFIHDKALSLHKVDPSTVGQYTGVKDKDGKEIWEGDIVAHLDTEFICTVIFQKSTAMFLAEEIDCERMGFGIDNINLVIGNIHENG